MFDWTNASPVTAVAPAGASRRGRQCTSTNASKRARGLSFVWFDEARLDAPVITASSARGPDFAPRERDDDGGGAWHSEPRTTSGSRSTTGAAQALLGRLDRLGQGLRAEYEVLVSNDGTKVGLRVQGDEGDTGRGLDLPGRNQRALSCGSPAVRATAAKGFGIDSCPPHGPDGAGGP